MDEITAMEEACANAAGWIRANVERGNHLAATEFMLSEREQHILTEAHRALAEELQHRAHRPRQRPPTAR